MEVLRTSLYLYCEDITQKQVYTPRHLLREPVSSNWSHELLQESLLFTEVFKLVTDENKCFHQSTFLHLSQQQIIGEQLLHMCVEHVKARLKTNMHTNILAFSEIKK